MNSQQSDTKEWYATHERGARWGMRFTFGVLKLLGRKGVAPLVYLVVAYFFAFGTTARRASKEYLSHVQSFAPEAKIHADAWTSFRHFLSFAGAILDKLDAWQGRIREDQVVFNGRQKIYEMVEKKVGGLIIGSHLGNMEVSRALGHMAGGVRMNVLVHTKHAENFNQLLSNAGANTVELIQVTEIGADTAMRLAEKVQNGEWIVIAGDRVPVNSGRIFTAPFLGEQAPFPQGPLILAGLLKCPVLLLFCVKHQGRYHVTMENFADRIIWHRKTRDQDIAGYGLRFAERLQHHCLTAPLQWFNFFSFWHQPLSSDSKS